MNSELSEFEHSPVWLTAIQQTFKGWKLKSDYQHGRASIKTSQYRFLGLTNVLGLSELTKCHRFQLNTQNKLFPSCSLPVGATRLVCSEFLSPSITWHETLPSFPPLYKMLRLTSNQAISSIDGSVRLASCLFVSADKGTAIRGRWTLLTVAILWLCVRHWHPRDNCVREIKCQLVPPSVLLKLIGFPTLDPPTPISTFFFYYLPASNFKSDPFVNNHQASTSESWLMTFMLRSS